MANLFDDNEEQMVDETTPSIPEIEQADDPRLNAALESQRKQRLYSDLMRGFQQALQGSAPNSGFKADFSMADTLAKRADDPVNQYKATIAQEVQAKKNKQAEQERSLKLDEFQMKMQKMKLDFKDMEANRDPNSPQSKVAQDRVIEIRQKIGQPVNEEAIRQQSGESLFKTFDFLHKDLTQYYQNENARLDREQQAILKEKTIAADKEKFSLKQEAKAEEMQEKVKLNEAKTTEKEQVQIRKEDRELRKNLDKAESSLETTINALKNYQDRFEKYSKKSPGGTGPISTLGGLTKYLSSDTQQLEADFNKIGLDEMVKMFQGMSKAVDSDAERRAFQSTQPALNIDDPVNKTIFKEKIQAAESLLKKTREAKAKFDKTNSFDNETQSSQPNISDTVKMRDPRGNIRMVPRDQVEAATKAGGEVIQ